MKIKLSDHFTYRRLLAFTLPSISMMIFTSIYGIVDGFFISNYAGSTPFAAINFIMPFLMILSTFGFMIGSGGGALIAKTLGEKNEKKANSLFSLFILMTIIVSIICGAISFFLIEPIARMMGATTEMIPGCVLYSRIIVIALPASMLQMEFQSFFPTAEKPKLGLVITLSSGITNMILDWLFVGVFGWSIAGAAGATAASQVVGGIVPLFYFAKKNNTSLLHLVRPKADWRSLGKACVNGSSEFMSNISMSIVGILYNIQLIRLAGKNGVSAYGVLMYVSFIFIAAFVGFSIGSAPLVGYNYGAQNKKELKGLLRKSVVIVGSFAITMFLIARFASPVFAKLYVGYDDKLCEITTKAFMINSWSYLFCGFAIYGSGFFTALNNGLISALISFLRTLVFQVTCIMIMPLIFGVDGIWWSLAVSEIMAFVITAVFIFAKRKKYGYM